MKKNIIFLLQIILLLATLVIFYYSVVYIWEGYNERKVYTLNTCANTCVKKGYSESSCLWISEKEAGMDNIGSCRVDRSMHCSKDGQCSCFCSNSKSYFKEYAKNIEPEVIKSKNINFFYVHVNTVPRPGYSWEVDFDQNYLELVDRIHNDDDDGTLYGSNATFRFHTINRGNTKMYLYYRKLWEDDVIPADVKVYDIKVQRLINM